MYELCTLKDAIVKATLEKTNPIILLVVEKHNIKYYYNYIENNYKITSARTGEHTMRINTENCIIQIVDNMRVLIRGYRADFILSGKDIEIDSIFSNCITRLIEVENKGQ